MSTFPAQDTVSTSVLTILASCRSLQPHLTLYSLSLSLKISNTMSRFLSVVSLACVAASAVSGVVVFPRADVPSTYDEGYLEVRTVW